jgi:hypothetical protein
MKKIYFTLLLASLFGTSFAQTKTSGLVTLSSNMSLQIDVNNTSNLVTFTMVGSTTKYLAFALNSTSMSDTNADCIEFGTTLLDRHLSGGQSQPITDTTNNLTLVSNTTSGTTRTIIFTRPLTTTDTTFDYQFNYATLTSLNIIWAVGPGNTVNSQHQSRGSNTLTFTTLGNNEFLPSLEKLTISPNPSNGIFEITKSNLITISKVNVFDINAKLIKEINFDTNQNLSIDLSPLSKGIYFLEISNTTDKIVKKIELK